MAPKCSELGISFNNEILSGFGNHVSASLKEYNLDTLGELVANFKEMI